MAKSMRGLYGCYQLSLRSLHPVRLLQPNPPRNVGVVGSFLVGAVSRSLASQATRPIFSSAQRTAWDATWLGYCKSLLTAPHHRPCPVASPLTVPQVRTVTKFSLNKGKRKSVKAVIQRFYRLPWGIWIRPRAGRQKKLYKKSERRKRKLRQHVFCNKTQSRMLDKMVTEFWKRRRYYIDDPYEPYLERENFPQTARKPRQPV